MDIRLYVPIYHDCAFTALQKSKIPESVIVMLLNLLPINEHVMVEVENADREYEIVKTFEYDLNDNEKTLQGLEITANWGESWLTWAYRKNDIWRGVPDNNPIQDFIVQRLIVAAEQYWQELSKI